MWSNPVPDMTYNVFAGTLNLTQSISHLAERRADKFLQNNKAVIYACDKTGRDCDHVP